MCWALSSLPIWQVTWHEMCNFAEVMIIPLLSRARDSRMLPQFFSALTRRSRTLCCMLRLCVQKLWSGWVTIEERKLNEHECQVGHACNIADMSSAAQCNSAIGKPPSPLPHTLKLVAHLSYAIPVSACWCWCRHWGCVDVGIDVSVIVPTSC